MFIMDCKVLLGPKQLKKIGGDFFDPPKPLFGGSKIGAPRISEFYHTNSLIMFIMDCKVLLRHQNTKPLGALSSTKPNDWGGGGNIRAP